MNGAAEELPPNTNNTPSNNKTMTIGMSQNFFLSIRKENKSFNVSIIEY